MAHYHDFDHPDHRRINYAELEQSSMGSKAILAVLAIIALAVILLFTFGDIESTTLESATGSAPVGALETTPAPATPIVPAE